MQRSTRLILGVLLISGAMLRLAVAWAPLYSYQLTRGPLVDDSFYCFTIARNIARGLGPTHDGYVLTTGFQPLYTFLLTPLYWLAGENVALPIHLGLTLLALVGVVTQWWLFRLGRLLGNERVGLYAAGMWGWSPYAIQHGMNGLETGLAAMFVAWTLTTYLATIRTTARPSYRQMAGFGALLGAMYLARVDTSLLILVIGLDYLLLRWRSRKATQLTDAPAGAQSSAVSPPGVVATIAVGGGVALLCILPWQLYVWQVSRSLLPESGGAVRFLSKLISLQQGYVSHSANELGFYLDNLATFMRILLAQTTAPIPGLPLGYVGHHALGLSSWEVVMLYGAMVLAIVGFRRRLSAFLTQIRLPTFTVPYALAMIVAYVVFVPGQWFYGRYMAPLVLIGTLWSALMLNGLVAQFGPRRFAAAATVGLMLFAVCTAHSAKRRLWQIDGTTVAMYYELSQQLDALPTVGEPIGVFQSGAIGYFMKRRFVALDGKVNHDAAAALRQRKLFSMLARYGVRTLVDVYPWLPALVIANCSDGELKPRIQTTTIERPRLREPWSLYHLDDRHR